VVSAGALETYADCPVKWLVERELQPGRLEPESEPIVRGSYMHDVLEQVLRRLARAVTPDSLPEALQILDQVLAEQPPAILPGQPSQLRRAAAEAIAADLRRYLRHEAATGCGWDPEGLELRFGFEGDEESLPPLQLGEGAARVAVRGVIDRVDIGPADRRAVVRDYKSGGARSEYQAGRWSSDRQLQVALYMLAVRELLGLDPVAGLYQPLRGRDLRARGMFLTGEPAGGELFENDGRDREGLEAALDEAAARAVSLAAKLRTGDVTPCPETCSREGCAYPGICRST
jgi:ATP-dependent helicase/DNAse subunit B